jgi:hypothetical protein
MGVDPLLAILLIKINQAELLIRVQPFLFGAFAFMKSRMDFMKAKAPHKKTA